MISSFKVYRVVEMELGDRFEVLCHLAQFTFLLHSSIPLVNLTKKRK